MSHIQVTLCPPHTQGVEGAQENITKVACKGEGPTLCHRAPAGEAHPGPHLEEWYPRLLPSPSLSHVMYFCILLEDGTLGGGGKMRSLALCWHPVLPFSKIKIPHLFLVPSPPSPPLRGLYPDSSLTSGPSLLSLELSLYNPLRPAFRPS